MKNLLQVWRLLHYAAFDLSQAIGRRVLKGAIFPLVKIASFLGLRSGGPAGKISRSQAFSSFSERRQFLNVWPADYFMLGISFNLLATALNLVSPLVGANIFDAFMYDWRFLVACVSTILAANYFALWKDDRYLVYFEAFDKVTGREKLKARWLTVVAGVGTFALFAFSFVLMSKAGV